MIKQKGKLIVLYGINNLGKSTQARMLVERLKFAGYKAKYIKYPIYDLKPSGVILNNYLRENNYFQLNAKEAQIMYSLNRFQYQPQLLKDLNDGITVIAEDYVGTGIAWGLGAGVKELFLKKMNAGLLKEDLALLFDGERFTEARENNHKHETNDDLTNKVRWAHLKLKEEYGWHKLDANDTISSIHDGIWLKVLELLEGKDNAI